MRSLSGSSLTTFLMLLPLIAVPLLAIFGIPEFSAVNASPSGEVTAPGGFSVTDRTTPPAQSIGQSTADVFAPVENGAANFPENRTRVERRADPFQTPGNSKATARSNPGGSVVARQMHGWVVDPNRSGKRTEPRHPSIPQRSIPQRSGSQLSVSQRSVPQPFGARPVGSARDEKPQSFAEYLQNRGELRDDNSKGHGSNTVLPVRSHANHDGSARTQAHGSPRKTVSAGRLPIAGKSTVIRGNNLARRPLTWQSAVHRLNALGIQDFRLLPGRNATQFHFSCRYTPASGGRVTHLFEAEASEPLKAVENVLGQIETWLHRRS